MNNVVREFPEVNSVLRLLRQQEKNNPASSYRKGWQLAQQQMEITQRPQPSLLK